MNVLSLFSGIGLHDLGLKRAGMTIAAQCEIDPWCLAVLEKNFPAAARFNDIRTLTADAIRDRVGAVDLITGGFPCQDISVAGKGEGLDGKRSGLWWEMRRLIDDLRPRWLLIENVPALRLRGSDGVLAALEELGYTCWPVVVGAWAVGAPHKRDRVWIVARLHDGGAEGHTCGPQLADHDGDGRGGPALHLPERGPLQSVPDAIGASAGEAMGDTERNGLRASRWPAAEVADQGCTIRWPARPGEPQHEWEAPRLVKPEGSRRIEPENEADPGADARGGGDGLVGAGSMLALANSRWWARRPWVRGEVKLR